ncbi:Suppressor of glycerol defect protein 1 [Colletotrichum sidae]|uniref:Suppressor of glycerol defect protein 1 n=1 Tax=Colletotrichum sidae TaxID=1347389 RepID=A0A4R8SS59_9PEZI|nr:Suppressor of glycerol defect protein 1 [Colletotrichum sidae]
MPPTPLALPTRLLRDVGAPERVSTSRSHSRWKTQDQTRKDRRKADRHSKWTQPSLGRVDETRRRITVASHPAVTDNREEGISAIQEPRSEHVIGRDDTKKRNRNTMEEVQIGSQPVPHQVSRAVRQKMTRDDVEIELLERKLGLKKGKKSIPKSFHDDGLDDLLGGLGDVGESENQDKRGGDAKLWLAHKRRKATRAHVLDKGRVSDQVDMDLGDDPIHDGEWDNLGGEKEFEEKSINNNHADFDEDDGDGSGTDCVLSDPRSVTGIDIATDEARKPARSKENSYVPPLAAKGATIKYVPPSMRAMSAVEADLGIRIRRKLQGPVNRVTETNMISITGEIEVIYRDHPRGHINEILIGLLMAQICDSTSKPDTLLVLSAGFIAALYKVVGVDFAAHFLAVAVDRFLKEKELATVAADKQQVPTKETSNLITLLAEMYMFRVISSNLIFDVVRLLLGHLSELNAELLLRIVRVAGPQLRKDDPLALKDIVSLIRPAVARIGEANLSVRTRFMIETISDLKNNKLKAGAQDLVILNEHVTRMKKLLGSLDTQRIKATEPLRVGLDDLLNADKTGKWWLVGASWAGAKLPESRPSHLRNAGLESLSDHDEASTGDCSMVIADVDDMISTDYAELAREQGMNTDVRRAIFVALVAAVDYEDAYTRILKLRLNKHNRREVSNVLVQCSGAQQHYNPYYTLVAKRFCCDSRIKHAFQDAIWTLFRRLGEPLFGEEPEEEDEDAADTRRLINTAKMVGTLIADSSLSLGILRPLNLAYIKEGTSLFVEVTLITVLQECSRVKGKPLDQTLSSAIGTNIAPDLAQNIGYFLRKRIRNSDLIDGKKNARRVKSACKLLEVTLLKPVIGADI